MPDGFTSEQLEAAERELAKRRGLSLAQYRAALDAASSSAAAPSKAGPRPDWIEAHKAGVEVPDFIKDKYATELTDGAMHLGLLSRYKHLRRDLYAYKRHHELPDWLAALPKESEWNDRQVAKGKIKPMRPASVRDDAARAYDRQRAKSYRARKLRAKQLSQV